jgi:hypothetical protein
MSRILRGLLDLKIQQIAGKQSPLKISIAVAVMTPLPIELREKVVKAVRSG